MGWRIFKETISLHLTPPPPRGTSPYSKNCESHISRYYLQANQELGERVQGEAQALLECALAAPATLRVDGLRVGRLCSLVAQLLSHGLTGRGVPAGWLPNWQATSKPSVLEMLRVRVLAGWESCCGM